MNTYQYNKLTRKIIKGYYEVYNELGTGFLESVYENAMIFVLRNDLSLNVKSQAPIKVSFRDKIVGIFKADLLVESKVIVELKAVSKMRKEHKAQLINYGSGEVEHYFVFVNFIICNNLTSIISVQEFQKPNLGN